MEYKNILYRQEGPIAIVSLNRPRYKNAQSRQLLTELDHALISAGEDTSVKVIILRGEGGSFSAGHDLGTPDQVAWREANPEKEFRERFAGSWTRNVEYTMRWRNIPKPVIAGIKGHTVFAGWMIASAADVVFAADDLQLLGSNFQYFSIPWDIGVRKAKELLFEARFIDAHTAEKLGLVSRVVSPERLDDELLEYAQRVAENDTFQIRMMKVAINHMQDIQGFTASIPSGFAFHMLSSIGEQDPSSARIEGGEKRRRPQVQRALNNKQRDAATQP